MVVFSISPRATYLLMKPSQFSLRLSQMPLRPSQLSHNPSLLPALSFANEALLAALSVSAILKALPAAIEAHFEVLLPSLVTVSGPLPVGCLN